jgi:two-component system response regulator WspF
MRIAIVNDSRMAVEALRRVVTSVPDYAVAWIAYDGEESVRLCATDVPDLILMDLMMPRMDGAEASRLIMRDSPCAILVVTATVGGHSSKVFEAMGWGALDAVNTPILTNANDLAPGSELLAKIAMIGRLIGKSKSRRRASHPKRIAQRSSSPNLFFTAIGASTGGPKALARVLAGLPPLTSTTITIVQHVDKMFAPGLAAWLSRESSWEVRVIEPNDEPAAGIVHLASTNDHLLLTPNLTFEYTSEPLENYYRPSVDVFFESVSSYWPCAGVGVLLTGMGEDGAKGLLSMRRAGWHTIAQDQESSVAYGMPRAAARLDAASEILPLDQIAAAIARTLSASQPLQQRSNA